MRKTIIRSVKKIGVRSKQHFKKQSDKSQHQDTNMSYSDMWGGTVCGNWQREVEVLKRGRGEFSDVYLDGYVRKGDGD